MNISSIHRRNRNSPFPAIVCYGCGGLWHLPHTVWRFEDERQDGIRKAEEAGWTCTHDGYQFCKDCSESRAALTVTAPQEIEDHG